MIEYFIVALLGAGLGSAELVSRYRDEPHELFKMGAAYFYFALNALISCASLYLMDIFGFAATGTDGVLSAKDLASNILIAGFGGAAFFRSSIARTKVGDVEIGIGPSFVIDTFLAATDRAIDRRRASQRIQIISKLMRGIPLKFAAGSLTQYCIGAMQNLSAADEKNLEIRTASSLNSKLPDSIRSMLIGMILTEYVGHAILVKAKTELEEEINQSKVELTALKESLDLTNLEAILESSAPSDDTDEGDGSGGADDADKSNNS